MSKQQKPAVTLAFVLALAGLSCEGPAGPPGAGFGSLDDPSVQPAVVYTYPPMNSEGPYPDFYVNDCGYDFCNYYSLIQVRFNKFMDVSSVRRAVRIASSAGDVTTDTAHVVSVGGDVVMVTPVDTNGSTTGARYRVGETYTLVVDTTATDVNGNRLRVPFSTTFVPEPRFRILQVWPADGQTGASTTSGVSIEFNGGVDTSIGSYISIEPPVEFHVSISYRWSAVSLYFVEPLSNGTTYTVTVDSGASDAEGHRMPEPRTWSFTTVGFRVEYAYPPDGATGVNLNRNFEVYFTSSFDTASLRGAFSIDPPAPGWLTFQYYYYGQAYARYVPASGWKGNTTYTVRIDTTVTSLGGGRLPGPFEARFTTDSFRIVWTSPWDGATDVSRFPYIRITTNARLDTARIRSAVSILPAVGLNFQADYDRSGFTVAPVDLLLPATQYLLRIDTTLRTVGGERLSFPDTLRFRTSSLE